MSDADGPRCAKCGGGDIATSYHAKGCDRENCSCTNCGYGALTKERKEHLHYDCRTCRFDWISPTLDAA